MTSNNSVVVADDDLETAQIVGEMLAKGGFKPIVVGSAYEALGYLVENQTNLIVSDVRMRGINGIELLEKLTSWRNPDFDVILMSGWTLMPDDQALALGSFGQLDKPFNMEQLLTVATAATKRLEDRWHANGVLPQASFRVDDQIVAPEAQKHIAFGRTGMFVPVATGALPAVESHVQLALPDAGIGPTNGIGVVRWIRSEAAPGLPRGIGVEYEALSDITRKALVKFLREERVVSCIPSHAA